MDVIYTFVVDFARPQRTNELIVMQNDHLTRHAKFILMNNGKHMDVSDVTSVTINALLPDDSTISAEAALSVDDDDNPINEVIYAIPGSMTSAIGKTVVTVTLYRAAEEGTQQISSFEFYVNTRNELNSNEEEDDDDMAGLKDLLERAAEAIELVEQMVAQTAMPNPYPLRVYLEREEPYDYDGSSMITLNFGNVISRVAALETAFPAGCSTIAQAVTDNGVTTASNASPSTITTNIGLIRSSGDATAANILSGKTAWSNKQLLTGSMANNSTNWTDKTLNCGQSYTIAGGYHSGSGKVTANSLASQTGVDSGKTAAGDAQILTGYQAWVNGSKKTGSMANRGAVSQALNCGGSYTGQAGYYSSVSITANSLSSQTQGTATAARILSGYTAWVNGTKLTGTYSPTGTVTKDFNLSGSVVEADGTRIHMETNLKLRVTFNKANDSITLSRVSGNISGDASIWIDTQFTNFTSGSFVPTIAGA